MLNDDYSDLNEYEEEDEDLPDSLEGLIDGAEKHPYYIECIQEYFIEDLDKCTDPVSKALGYMDIAFLGHGKLPFDMVFGLVLKALKTHPRVHSGMQFFIELCSELFYIREEDSEYELRFSERHVVILIAILTLSNYKKEKIENILYIKDDIIWSEAQVIMDFGYVCLALDALFFTADPKKDKKALYDILCTRINPDLAAVMAITINGVVPPPFARAFYFVNGSEKVMKEMEHFEDEEEFHKYYDLLSENKDLKKEIELLKKSQNLKPGEN